MVVLAVEGLGFDRVPCQSDGVREGFATLCQESVRFTHAYGNSTNSLANLATVLTGLFPWEHGLRGQTQWLRPHRETIAEEALKNGYATSFFSSGLPVLSSSGLGQGFEHFDDRIDLFRRPHFRPAQEVVSRFLNWLPGRNSDSFLTVLHFSDLFYPFVPSQTIEGELRDLSVTSRLEEVSEEVELLISELKEENLWDNTYVVLVGLAGGRDPSSLKSAQTQVALLLKPARLKKDQGTAWGVDFNISLADLGLSLREVIGSPLPEKYREDKVSLSSVYTDPTPDWDENRLILTEMYWAFENFGLDIVRSGRRGYLFYIHSRPPLLFNTLTDRQEQNPLPMTDNIYALNFDSFKVLLEKGYAPSVRPEVPEWFYGGVSGFRQGTWDQLEEISPLPEVAKGWLLRYWFENKNFEKIIEYFKDEPLVHFVAQSKLDSSKADGDAIRNFSCSQAFLTRDLMELENLRDSCDQDRLLQYVDWARYKESSNELYYENRFRRSFQFWWSRLELGAMNYASFGALGLPLSWPRPPDVSELFLIHREREPRRELMEGYTSVGKYN